MTRVVSPWLISTITMILLAMFIGFVLPISTTLKLMIFTLLALALLLPLLGTFLGIDQAQRLADVSEARRHKLLAPLAIITRLLLWQQWRAQTRDYINQDNDLQQLEWQAQKQRSVYISGIQWLFYSSILLVLFRCSHFGTRQFYQCAAHTSRHTWIARYSRDRPTFATPLSITWK